MTAPNHAAGQQKSWGSDLGLSDFQAQQRSDPPGSLLKRQMRLSHSRVGVNAEMCISNSPLSMSDSAWGHCWDG